MRKNNFRPKFVFHNNEKPKMNLGDISLESESYNDSIDGKNNIINNDNSYDFPKENIISSISISNSIYDEKPTTYSKNNQLKHKNIDMNNIGDFNMMKRPIYTKENDRYNNISEIYNNNLLFLSICESDYHEEDDDIVNFVNSEINSQYNDNEQSKDNIKGFNISSKFTNGNNVEVILEPNISKIYSSDEISDFKLENIINNNKNEKESNLESKNTIEENNNNKNYQKNEISENKIIENKNNSKSTINNIDNKSNNYKNQFEELRDSKKFYEKNKGINKNKVSKFLSITKQNKIFQKFLIVSVDTSGLYSLDDEMDILILNPKITYNYPFNKKERELD